jgi:dynein heavy chain
MTDAQVADEKFLVLINDLLASGEIPDLFADDEIENIINGVRNEVKSTGMEDSRENCWKFFIEKVRKTLKVLEWMENLIWIWFYRSQNFKLFGFLF